MAENQKPEVRIKGTISSESNIINTKFSDGTWYLVEAQPPGEDGVVDAKIFLMWGRKQIDNILMYSSFFNEYTNTVVPRIAQQGEFQYDRLKKTLYMKQASAEIAETVRKDLQLFFIEPVGEFPGKEPIPGKKSAKI